MKRTKIVSTIGPATRSKEKLKGLIEEGVDVIRRNFSHVDQEAHAEIYNKVRQVSEKTAIMADTKGPEIRLGQVEEGTVLKRGQTIKLASEEVTGSEEKLPIKYKELPQHIEIGDKIKIDDGKIELEENKVDKNTIDAEVIYGGELRSRKAVNVPGKDIGLSALTKKDKQDIKICSKERLRLLISKLRKRNERRKESKRDTERKKLGNKYNFQNRTQESSRKFRRDTRRIRCNNGCKRRFRS